MNCSLRKTIRLVRNYITTYFGDSLKVQLLPYTQYTNVYELENAAIMPYTEYTHVYGFYRNLHVKKN